MKKESIQKQTKLCVRCKREFSNRKSLESRGNWDEVKFCSERCRKNKQVNIQN